SGTTTAESWEFPVLVKRYFGTALHPYGNAGVSVRQIREGSTLLTNGQFQTTEEPPFELTSNRSIGFVFGGGLDISKCQIHVQPYIRYTRWRTSNFSSPNGVLASNLNSVDLLIGVTFRKE